MNRLVGALIAYVVLGVLTWMTIPDSRIRGVTFAILAMFAVKSVLRRKDVLRNDVLHDDVLDQGGEKDAEQGPL